MAALENRDVVEDIHRAFADRRELILERLAAVDGIDAGTPRGAFYVFADVSDLAADSRTFVDALMAEAGVAAVPGAVFGESGEGHVRFSYATDASTIETAMDRLEGLLESA
jgi:aspartate/methionine/tyrosine aminotransferase